MKAFNNFKSKSVRSNAFFICKSIYGQYIYSESLFNALYIEIRKCSKTFLSDKIDGTKNVLVFLSRAPIHHSFTFNLRFFYELTHKDQLSKTVRGVFYFRFPLVYINVYIFVQQKGWSL